MLFSPSLFGQGFQATITGVVTDQLGAVVPNATIEIKNLGTNAKITTVTNEAGNYVAAFVLPGTYSVTASSQGFKNAVRRPIELHIAARVTVDFKLELGTVTEQVTVSAEAGVLETASASLGHTIGSAAVASLPLNSFNVALLGALSPGVYYDATGASTFNGRPMDGSAGFLSMNGSGGSNYDILIDGAPDMSLERSTSPYNNLVPSVEAVQEFKIQTNVYDAQYGRTSNGFLSMELKSGTNQIHGALYENWRNDIITANRFENNAAGQPKAKYRFNQPGLEFDGPIYLPKIYDGRNRTFFMYSWEAMRSGSPYSDTETLPTVAERGGDFSATTQSNGQPIIIYDPLTTQASGNAYARQPFGGDKIPASRVDPVAAKLAGFIPLPNVPGIIGGFNNYFKGNLGDIERYDQHIVRVDQVLSDRRRLFGSITRNLNHEYQDLAGWPAVAASSFIHHRGNVGAHSDFVDTISPSLVLDTRLSFMRHVFAIQFAGDPWDPSQLGWPSSLIGQLPAKTFPYITISNYTNFGPQYTPGGANDLTYTNNYALAETLSKSAGSHGLKIGGEVRVMRSNWMLPDSSSGQFAFDKGFSQANPLVGDAASGDGFASMLLGYPSSGYVPYNILPAYGDHYYAWFVQDDWRISSRLSLNLGLRWSYESGMSERYNRQNRGFDPNASNTFQVPGLQLKGGLLFADSDHRLAYAQDFRDYQPRVGVAYRLRSKLVFRAGYGKTYAPFMNHGYNNGFSAQTTFVSSVDGGLTPYNTLSNPFPAGILRPAGASQGLATLVGNPLTYGYYDRVTPRTHQFSAGFQQELPWRAVVDVSYVGQQMDHLLTSKNINVVSGQQYVSLGAGLLTPVPNPFQGLLPGTSFNGATVPKQQLLLPFPQFGNITQAQRDVGYAWYNSAQIRLEKRLSEGLQFQLSGTICKDMTATSYLNTQDPVGSLERKMAGDPTDHWALNVVYAPPFFKGSTGVVKQVLSGWQANLIFNWQSGWHVAGPSGAYSTGINPALPSDQQSFNRWFNTCTITLKGSRQNCASADQQAAWIIQPAYTLRTLGTVLPTVTVGWRRQGDLSVFKNFPLRERLVLQFRAAAYNFTNTPWFSAPSTSINSANFGVITLSQANDPRYIQLMMRLSF
jgi:hypothetical protein